MSTTAVARDAIATRRGAWQHGVRLAIAVVIAYAVSTLAGLPESFWAVMSTLIVVRPTAGSTLGAGWDRVRGTLGGTLVGLAGVWIHHTGLGSQAVTLSIIAVMAFASAVVPALRSAPISALIILNSSGIAGHSALEIAGLRAIEIAIGVATGVVVSLAAFATHARERFAEASADWLRETARHAGDDLATPAPAAGASEGRSAWNRAALRAVAELAAGADREARWLPWARRSSDATIDRAACARMLTRIASDVGSVVRAAGCAPEPLDVDARQSLAHALEAALHATADALTAAATPAGGYAALRSWASPSESPHAWVAPASHLLLQDLRHLSRIGARAEPRP